MSAKKPGFYGKFIILTNGVDEETGFLGSECLSPGIEQDVEAVESQKPLRLPLDLQAEYHLPSDRATVTYRKWLKQLGVTFGTIPG